MLIIQNVHADHSNSFKTIFTYLSSLNKSGFTGHFVLIIIPWTVMSPVTLRLFAMQMHRFTFFLTFFFFFFTIFLGKVHILAQLYVFQHIPILICFFIELQNGRNTEWLTLRSHSSPITIFPRYQILSK